MGNKRSDIRRQVVVVGDSASGKTALLNSFHRGTFIAYHSATLLNNFSVNMTSDGKDLELIIHDTAGLPDYSVVRPISYPMADVIMLCVALNSSSSLDDVLTKWIPELREHCPRVPIILVGTKKDLRRRQPTSISTESGKAMAVRINASGYYECSARTREGIAELMQMVARVALMHRRKKSRSCVIM